MRILTSPHCYEIEWARRSWFERLFTRPWKPEVGWTIKRKPTIYRVGDDIICHPLLLPEIRKQFTEAAILPYKKRMM